MNSAILSFLYNIRGLNFTKSDGYQLGDALMTSSYIGRASAKHLPLRPFIFID
jgi:hypothetical protein